MLYSPFCCHGLDISPLNYRSQRMQQIANVIMKGVRNIAEHLGATTLFRIHAVHIFNMLFHIQVKLSVRWFAPNTDVNKPRHVYHTGQIWLNSGAQLGCHWLTPGPADCNSLIWMKWHDMVVKRCRHLKHCSFTGLGSQENKWAPQNSTSTALRYEWYDWKDY